MKHYPAPVDLVEALHRGDPEARASLERLLRERVQLLIFNISKKNRVKYDNNLLIERSIRWLEMYLRSFDPSDFAGTSENVLCNQLFVALLKVFNTPSLKGESIRERVLNFFRPLAVNSRTATRPLHSTEQQSGPYKVWTYSSPLDQVGGDWSDMDARDEGNVWVFVADITGHGYPAFILANGLPFLWKTQRIVERRSQGCTPCELLDELSHVLEPILPDGVFVEATAARFGPTGQAAFSGAGVCRVVLRRSGDGLFEIHHLGGLYLGFEPSTRDQLDWVMRTGDEVMLGSDGLFEQQDSNHGQSRLEASLVRRSAGHLIAGRSLHATILSALQEALGECPQCDDITVVTVQFNGDAPAAQGDGHAEL
jgi:serine phosphatase RsbU (regulator of sigma subunit)